MKIRILIADSSRATRRLLESRLSSLGFEVVLAASSNQALAKLSQFSFSMLVTSLILPDEAGTDLIRAIRNRPGLRHLPAILITGEKKSLQEIDPGNELRLGAVLEKSIGLDEMAQSIATFSRQMIPSIELQKIG